MKTLFEYIREAEISLYIPSAENSNPLKKIKPRDWAESLLTIYFLDLPHECHYFVIDSRFGIGDPIGNLGFLKVGEKMLCARNAVMKPEFQKRGILSELMLFVKQRTGFEIISDTVMSDAGIALWRSLEKSGKFSMKIVDAKYSVKYDFSEIGIPAEDGTPVLDPKDDTLSPELYNSITDTGQRFFYILESDKQFHMMIEGKSYHYGYLDNSRDPDSLLSPSGYFERGDP